MDCGACGKPISLTAKFCGKCGAPVKRPAAPVEQDLSTPSLLDSIPTDAPHAVDHDTKTPPAVDDLVLTLDVPQPLAEHAAMLKIDLDLVVNGAPEVQAQPSQPAQPAAVAEHTPATTAPTVINPPAAQALETRLPDQWLKDWAMANQQIQEKLEKHAQLLDTLVLNSQQPAQAPKPTETLEPLVRELLERQTQLATQLSSWEQLARPSAEPPVIKLPDEFKLHLEKQKIELLKAFSQNLAQNTTNVESANQQTLARIEALMAENTAATQTLEVHLAPISQSVSDLKARMLSLIHI